MDKSDDEESWMSRTRFPIYRVTNVGVIVAITTIIGIINSLHPMNSPYA